MGAYISFEAYDDLVIHLLWSYNCYLCQSHLIICQAMMSNTDWVWYDSSYQGSTSYEYSMYGNGDIIQQI